MKPEPLTKEKIVSLESVKPLPKKADLFFFYFDVKSAVEWLLKGIEKRDFDENRKIAFKEFTTLENEDYCQGIRTGLEIAKDLIKKAFSGVLEE